ncbi:hypothetical protein ACFLRX_06900 [Acidobacteriota bacterium]
MKKISLVGVLLFICVIFIFFNFSWDQEFQKIDGIDRIPTIMEIPNGPWAKSFGLTHGHFFARSMQKTNDGGFVVLCGHSLASNWGGSYVSKLTSSGDIEWVRSYGGILNSLVLTADGGFLAAGNILLKLDQTGKIDWQWNSDHEDLDSALQTTDGGYILGGRSSGINTYSSCLIKLSPTREIEWKKKFGWNERWGRFLIKQTQDNGYIGASYTSSYGSGENDILVMKFNVLGEIVWQKCYGGPEGDSASSIEMTSEGGYILAGHSESFLDGRDVLWIIKLFQNGEIEWQKYYDGIDIEETSGSEIIQTADGGYVVVGNFDTGFDDFLILKLSPGGDIEWQRKFGSDSSNEYATEVLQADDGEFVIAGTTTGLGVESDNSRYPASNFLVTKISRNGELDPCSYLGITDLYEQNTSLSPLPSLFSLEDFTLELSDYTATVTERTLNSSNLCWTLNQPPSGVSLSGGINRSLFMQEFVVMLTWDPNPYNQGFVLNKYRVYRKPAGDNEGAYQLLGEVPANSYKFLDRFSDTTKQYLYVLTSVDSDGNESPRSIPVGNI